MAAINPKKIGNFQISLLRWYEINGRCFPWREGRLTQYQVIIAEALLQRTKAETISKFYVKFIADFPNWNNLSKTKIEELETYLKPIGLYRQRALRLKKLALEMEKRRGKLPTNRSELESIPFMGQYMVNAIELILYSKPLPLLDVNMARLLERYFGERKMADIRFDPYLQELACQVVNHEQSKEISWAILDYSALVCKSQKPLCKSCFFRQKCLYFKSLN
jgi:A/G-specific adenine glycosylase